MLVVKSKVIVFERKQQGTIIISHFGKQPEVLDFVELYSVKISSGFKCTCSYIVRVPYRKGTMEGEISDSTFKGIMQVMIGKHTW